GVGHPLGHRLGDHAADGVGHLLDALLGHTAADGVGHLLDAVLLDHAAGGGADVAANLGAFLERPARAFAVVADALLIDVGAADRPAHRLRDLFFDDFRHRPADGVGHLLGAGFLDGAGHRAGHLLGHRVGDLAADGVGHLLANAVPDGGRAGHLFAHGADLPDLAAADLRRFFADRLSFRAGAAGRLAGAGVAGASGLLRPAHGLLAGLAILLGDPLADALVDRLAGGDLAADGLDTVLVARLGHLPVAGLAHVFHDALGDRLADRVAHVLVAGLLNLPVHVA